MKDTSVETAIFGYLKKNFKGKDVLIIDVSYSGETLNAASEMICCEGGNPIKLAVWTKSKLSVANSEYILFLDKMVKTQNVCITNPNWCVNLYEKIAFNNSKK